MPTSFDSLPLSSEVRKALEELGYREPTPVQLALFEVAARGKDTVVQARTGTGKTTAFGLPLVDSLVRPQEAHVQALVLTPTRELALQVKAEIEKLAKYKGISCAAIYGGAPFPPQVESLKTAQLVCGTPGRVLDHLRRGTFDGSHVRILVLDEADEMLSMGFLRELNAIIDFLPKERQGIFVSATVPPDIERLAHAKLKEPEFITLSSDQVGALEIAHYVYHVTGAKRDALLAVLEVENPESAIIFCNTKDETERVATVLANKGYSADWLNGDMEQKARERVMTATREGGLRFLVATDVAARGIDISHLTHVINHDFPESTENYVHRTGRTGRAGRTGTAISLIEPKDIGNLYMLRLTYKLRPTERLLPSKTEVKSRGEMDAVEAFVRAFADLGRSDAGDLAIARRLLSHDAHVEVIAGMIRTHLGAKAETPETLAQSRRERAQPAVTEAVEAKTSEERPRREPRPDRPRREREREPRAAAAAPSPAQPAQAAAPAKSAHQAPQGAQPVADVSAPPASDEVQMYLNVGKRDGISQEALRDLLTARGVTEFGAIRLKDRMTFVALKPGAFEAAKAGLQGAEIGGRSVVVEIAKVR